MQDLHIDRISTFIWSVADEVLPDLCARGKYRDVILPMTVLRRLDVVLESTKEDVLEQNEELDAAEITSQDGPLKQAVGQDLYNASRFTLRSVLNTNNREQLAANFAAYLDGFSTRVQDILRSFEFYNQNSRLSAADTHGTVIEMCSSHSTSTCLHIRC